MVDIFEEIKEEAKEEQWLNLWKKYQNHVYGFILGCVVLTSAYVFWQRHQMSQNVEASGKYIAGLRASGSNQLKTALSILEDIPLNTGGAYKDLSRFMVASLLQDQGDDQGAKEVYRGIVNDTGASK